MRTSASACHVLIGTALLAGALRMAAAPAQAADREALRQIVQWQCLPDWRQSHDPSPCVQLVPGSGEPSSGYAVLPDRKGGAHFLLVPLRPLTGIESPALLRPGTPNYFAAAWSERRVLSAATGRPVPREAVGLAINRVAARGQDQLHIHIECVGQALYAALHRRTDALGTGWSPLRVGLWTYRVRRLAGAELRADPFQLLASEQPRARGHMGEYTLVLVGMRFADGPGFALVSGEGRMQPSGELLLDSRCAVAGSLTARR